ncbi:MMPL family transporter [Gryllotalpicola protaetiae]|uniref:MMPL family transporter n=1 Tax=Gryllotalpicola protaetiae TaxID=2419771 RepID=A0A387BIR5_9MICO|nr:MMPL family transporter [Gryllotalpicola protaetiae]AYG03975.1 MMPL family transporter [Gryllotalpicola protaetiae]
MASVLYALGRWITRFRWVVLVGWVVLLALVGGGAALFSKGFDNSVSIPGTEAQQALDQLSRTFPQVSGATAQLVVVAPDGSKVTDAGFQTALDDEAAALTKLPGVSSATSPFDADGGLVSKDGRAGIISIQMSQGETDVTDAQKDALQSSAHALEKSLPVGSQAVMGGSLFSTSFPAISATEGIGLIIAILVLVVTFGSFLAAGLPLLSALLGIGVSMAAIYLLTLFGPITSTTPMLALMLGLAVGIDYALFIISRHLDQRRHGMEFHESIARALATAGSAVVFAGVTVIIALLGLAVANIPFLTTMGSAAALGIAVAVLMSLTMVPALLAFCGPRLGAPRQKRARVKPRVRGGDVSREPVVSPAHTDDDASDAVVPEPPKPNRFFLGWVRAATKWPVVTIVVVAGILSLAVFPASKLRLDLTDAGQLPASSPARQAYDLISDHFGPGYNGPLIVTGTIVTSTDPVGLMSDLAAEIKKLPDVAAVPLSTPNQTADTGIIQVIPKSAPTSQATADLVKSIRDLRPHLQDKYGVTISVTGFTALGIDVSDRLAGALLPFGALVVGLSLILLAMVFRSIAVPVKATIGYLFSVVASLGAVSAVFVLGWGDKALGVEQTGPVISFLPIILMGVLFGLAMDYEVFLVSRMREEWVHKGNAKRAVETGFLGSAKVVTAAAIIMFGVFASFFPEGDSTIKPMALGLAVGVFVDAFLVRMTLVPAVLALLGEWAWRLPKWLDRALPKFDIEGEGLERELALADWPEAGSDLALAADGVGLGSPRGPVFEDFSARVPRGAASVITAPDPTAVRAIMLAVSGRARPDSGTLKVLGHVLPERAGAVRRRSAYVELETDASAGTLVDVLRPGLELVALDGVDRITDPAAIAALRQTIADLVSGGDGSDGWAPVTVLIGTTQPSRAQALLPASARSVAFDSDLAEVK